MPLGERRPVETVASSLKHEVSTRYSLMLQTWFDVTEVFNGRICECWLNILALMCVCVKAINGNFTSNSLR